MDVADANRSKKYAEKQAPSWRFVTMEERWSLIYKQYFNVEDFMDKVKIIELSDISESHAQQIVDLLNYDEKLRHALGAKEKDSTKEGYISFCKEWSKNNNAEIGRAHV